MVTNKNKSNLNRRQFIRTGAAALAGAAIVPSVLSGRPAEIAANATIDSIHNSPGFYRFTFN